jgi:hypothetical protein
LSRARATGKPSHTTWPTLSVYLGHASVANTYWYLEATPVLLRDIAAASEQLYRGEAA